MRKINDLIKELDSSIPRDEISKRSAGGSRQLSYLEGWYVINRMNAIFGQGNWSYRITNRETPFNGTVKDRYGKEVYAASVVAQVLLQVEFIDEKGKARSAQFEEVGYGNGTDKTNPGAPYELANKEAVTDGLKRAAKNLGMSMGLALYDKTQEFVGDERSVKSTNGNGKAVMSRSDAISLVKARSSVVIAKGLKTLAELQEYMQVTYNTASADNLKLDQAKSLLAYLDNLLNIKMETRA